jgi:hypothetical protein
MRLDIFNDAELIEQLAPMPTPSDSGSLDRMPTVLRRGRCRDVGYDVSDAIDDICMVLHEGARHRWDAA